jgi:hypothetical protein
MIDYRKLADSIDFFEKHGFKRIEAPWWVSQEIMNITAPKDKVSDFFIPHNRKCLVASGEQSFLYTAAKGRLPPGRYQTTTPCFRDEAIGVLHKKCFMKNELIITDTVTEQALHDVIVQCFGFFSTQVPDRERLTTVQTEVGFDIEYDGIEVGSYGMRSCDFMDWIYATACAEPRLSRAIAISNKRRKKK